MQRADLITPVLAIEEGGVGDIPTTGLELGCASRHTHSPTHTTRPLIACRKSCTTGGISKPPMLEPRVMEEDESDDDSDDDSSEGVEPEAELDSDPTCCCC